jgi:hypothetical protein
MYLNTAKKIFVRVKPVYNQHQINLKKYDFTSKIKVFVRVDKILWLFA